MPSSSSVFLVKVVVASGAIGAFIKYALPALGIQADPSFPVALGLLLGPAALMAVLLGLAPVQRPPQA